VIGQKDRSEFEKFKALRISRLQFRLDRPAKQVILGRNPVAKPACLPLGKFIAR